MDGFEDGPGIVRKGDDIVRTGDLREQLLQFCLRELDQRIVLLPLLAQFSGTEHDGAQGVFPSKSSKLATLPTLSDLRAEYWRFDQPVRRGL